MRRGVRHGGRARALYRYLTESLGALPAIGRIETAPIIRTVKRFGAVLPL
ncbi:hypothetical protein [Nonomuraea jabiensis]|uniref:Uncharacterized protein n=1 Tax=Nonomuraea jabiensis TaxID=882448 RepID=A0A7W9G214_9ACTN|nr:hypothetical protein [Nonomuraea jabiensis]MBB5775805.1 hypothetical protein [Nonomuraea jabiensis]